METKKNFIAEDPDFKNRVERSFASQRFMRYLEATVLNVEPGYCEIRVPYREAFTQQHKFFHAGVTGAIADTACGYAAFSLMPYNYTVLTVEYKLNLLKPAVGEFLVAKAWVLRSGALLKVSRADVFGIKEDGKESLCATSLSTIMAIAGRPDRPTS